jgi:hypothetical protein
MHKCRETVAKNAEKKSEKTVDKAKTVPDFKPLARTENILKIQIDVFL